MNINNNLKAPGFWYIDINGAETGKTNSKETPKNVMDFLITLRNIIIHRLALGCLINETYYNGLAGYYRRFDWFKFPHALTAAENIWEKEYAQNIHAFLELVSAKNPQMKIVFLGEAINEITYPPMLLPFNKAKEILRSASTEYHNVYCLDLQPHIIAAARRGGKVWQTPSFDPLHLSSRGNEIIAQAMFNFLQANHL